MGYNVLWWLQAAGALSVLSNDSPDSHHPGKYIHKQNPWPFLQCHLSAMNTVVVVTPSHHCWTPSHQCWFKGQFHSSTAGHDHSQQLQQCKHVNHVVSYQDSTHMRARGSGYTSPNPWLTWEFESIQWNWKAALIIMQ